MTRGVQVEERLPVVGVMRQAVCSGVQVLGSVVPVAEVLFEYLVNFMVIDYLSTYSTRQRLEVQLILGVAGECLNHRTQLVVQPQLVAPLNLRRHLCSHDQPSGAMELVLDVLDDGQHVHTCDGSEGFILEVSRWGEAVDARGRGRPAEIRLVPLGPRHQPRGEGALVGVPPPAVLVFRGRRHKHSTMQLLVEVPIHLEESHLGGITVFEFLVHSGASEAEVLYAPAVEALFACNRFH